MLSKTIVILGGGVGGIVAANQLRKYLDSNHRIILIERNSEHAFSPSFLWLMTGGRRPDQVSRPLRSLLLPGVEFVQGCAESIDLSARRVRTTGGEFQFDFLVIALGAILAPESIPGLAGNAETFYTFEGAISLQRKLSSFRGGRVALVVAGAPYKCPAAPHEGAMLIGDYFHRRGIRDEVDIHIYSPEPQPMPVAGPELGGAVTKLLDSKGIEFHGKHVLAAVDQASRTIQFAELGAQPFDLLIAVPPHAAPALVREAGLANAAGWVPVNAETLETPHEGVFAIGDVTSVSIPGRWKVDVPMLLPKAGVFAHAQADVVATRIADRIAGRIPRHTFSGPGYCMLETGEHAAGFAYGNFFAEPSPQIKLHQVGPVWHIGKVLFEKWWLSPPGIGKAALGWALKAAGRAYGVPVVL